MVNFIIIVFTRPPDYAALLDAPTRRLIDYSYTALTRRQRW